MGRSAGPLRLGVESMGQCVAEACIAPKYRIGWDEKGKKVEAVVVVIHTSYETVKPLSVFCDPCYDAIERFLVAHVDLSVV